MTDEQKTFLSRTRYPAFITTLEVCWILGLELHQIKILIEAGKIIPAGKRRHRKGRLFITAYILELADDREWLNTAKDILSRHWEKNNALRKRAPKHEAIR